MNLLAANVNFPKLGCSGSGIYSGRMGALQVFVSETPATKILIAKLPIDLPADDRISPSETVAKRVVASPNDFSNFTGNISYFSKSDETNDAIYLKQDDLSEYSMNFLNFAEENLSQSGTVCNRAICCSYSVKVTDNGELAGKVRF